MTFEKNIYVIFAVLMNLLTLALVIRLFLSLHSGHVRKSLTAFSFSYLVWLNGIITLRLFDLSYSVSNLIVEIQLIGVNLMIHSFLYFVFAFSDPDQLERKRNLIFPFNLIFLTALILMGLIQSALIGENGYRPKYETVFPYFAVTLALTSIYGIYFMYSSYRRVSDEFIQFQYKYILIVSLITTTALTVAQGILPIFQGDNEITFYNNFIWPAVFIFAVFQLLSKGRILFLQSVFKDLIKFRDFRIEQNMPNLRKIIYAMKKVFEGSHGEMQKSFSFDLPNGKEYRFSFTGKNGRNQDRWLIQEPLNSSRTMNRITGLLDVILDMESENRRLLGLLAKAKTYLNGQVKIQEQTDEHSIVSGIIGSLQ
ncbi:MAG: hypothetical protein OEZ34_02655, partial [Spirochaetia bacterium]|nr:hypothetical protein [Spirochaetia bacterium]